MDSQQINTDEQNNIDFIDFNDGHCPGSTTIATKLAIYRNKVSARFLTIYDHLLDMDWCNKAYEYACNHAKPWGTYITTMDALNIDTISCESLWNNNEYEKAIALHAVRSLLLDSGKGKNTIGSDIERIHGTAVWCLTSDQSDSVQYHIDYAELYRYETNIIFPPLYAGTCQVSPLNGEKDMIGGDFMANINGINHYKKFGYKGKLSSSNDLKEDSISADWITVKYKCNRGILHDGNYPHLSTPVHYIKSGYKRVIIGFNCFPKDLAECNSRAPEHSDAFNRTIKLYQTMAHLGVSMTTTNNNLLNNNNTCMIESNIILTNSESINQTEEGAVKGINIKDIMKNKALAKLLVTAAKQIKSKEILK